LQRAEFIYHLQRAKFTRFSQKMEFARRKFSFVCEIRFARCKFGALREASEFSEQIYVFLPQQSSTGKSNTARRMKKSK
jgi:hypothetical protein